MASEPTPTPSAEPAAPAAPVLLDPAVKRGWLRATRVTVVLPAGGVAIFDSQGTSVVLSADGVAKVTASVRVEIDAPLTRVTQNLSVGGNIVALGNISDQGGAKSMADMRTTYNQHDHPLPGGGTSGDPNQQQ